MRVLVVTAVAAERDAVTAAGPPPRELPLPGGSVLHRCPPAGPDGPALDVLAAGVGPAAAAAAAATALTAAALSGEPYDLVVTAGIAGGFAPGAPLGSLVVSEALVAADLGARTPDDGFLSVAELGFGTDVHRVPEALVDAVAGATGALRGEVLTVSTATGSAARAAELVRRHPAALAEAMEGFGAAEAAAAHRVPVLELRAVSNAVGPRDRAAWRIGEALAALTEAFRKLSTAPVLAEKAEPPR
ncbi:futalosine hydrolase [Streptomyces cinnamoneus]|uniref:Futalosine hydrolase n=1 Tax=Streptomyces cinnamoneus TaxID=53446 RepID=A0A2G1XCA2_STRCJ|nr:futalosine hydrolase [Streptomyces cinnamoneus]PHQ48856.1 futalosine hydrolase [Streptomyces cinnamoneus]PPT14497.1 futalosine hydrolase [Streptomyces cinnamoneus]